MAQYAKQVQINRLQGALYDDYQKVFFNFKF